MRHSFHAAVEKMPREKLRALQLEKLRTLLFRLMGANHFYSKKWRTRDIGAV